MTIIDPYRGGIPNQWWQRVLSSMLAIDEKWPSYHINTRKVLSRTHQHYGVDHSRMDMASSQSELAARQRCQTKVKATVSVSLRWRVLQQYPGWSLSQDAWGLASVPLGLSSRRHCFYILPIMTCVGQHRRNKHNMD